MVPRRLVAVFALLIAGLIGIGVTAAVKRTDDADRIASPRATASPEPDPSSDVPTDEPSPVESPPSDLPSPTDLPSPADTATPAASPSPGSSGSGSGSGSGSSGGSQAPGPGAPSTPETGPVTAVLFVGAFSAVCAIAVQRRYFR